MAGIYIYIFRARKRLSLLICKSRRDAVSLLIENHRESKIVLAVRFSQIFAKPSRYSYIHIFVFPYNNLV